MVPYEEQKVVGSSSEREDSGSYSWTPPQFNGSQSDEAKRLQSELVSAGPGPSTFQLHPGPEHLKSYEKMVAQIIRESIEKENRALKQQIKQLQMNEQKRNHMRNPFQPKNPKIFSKPNFPISKSFSGRNSAFKYRPGGSSYFNF